MYPKQMHQNVMWPCTPRQYNTLDSQSARKAMSTAGTAIDQAIALKQDSVFGGGSTFGTSTNNI